MAEKLSAYLQRAGVAEQRVLRAYNVAMVPRHAQLGDVFHPEMLHPARTALILLEDARVVDESILAAGCLTETEYGELHLKGAAIEEACGPHVRDLVAAVPNPAQYADGLAEALVTLESDVAMIAAAERLDHARHLHFREQAVWRPFHQQIVEIYLPFADRVHPTLAARMERWAGAFEKRL